MKRLGWKISLYIVRTVLPYFAFSWLLLSVVLFIQQGSRYSDIFFNNNLPSVLIWQLTGALIPSVVAFTCPMAVLVGVIIGLSKMQGDSELVAIRAFGVGNAQITLPLAALGILLTLFAFFINIEAVPFAARVVRQVAIQAAVKKLESPIEPGVFNTEIQGYTFYVRDGDARDGEWKNIFIFNTDKNDQMRLIISKSGRIDSTQDKSELILENALVTTFSEKRSRSESIENLRFNIPNRRAELVEKLSRTGEAADELGLDELWRFAEAKTGRDRIEALLLWQRKVILSVTPLIFAALGAALVLRFNRRGRGMGVFLALLGLIAYYLLALTGEQLARTGILHVGAAGLLPNVITVAAIVWFFLAEKSSLGRRKRKLFKIFKSVPTPGIFGTARAVSAPRFATGILDFDIFRNLLKYYLLTLAFLGAIYLIFTTLELWKHAGSINDGINLLGKYLFFLLPFIYLQIAPSGLMIAALAAYVIKSRQNEVVVWTAAGQSVYRLLVPCFAFMLIIGFVNWEIQERLLPPANRTQDALRAQIRNRGVLAAKEGKFWVATEKRIFSFEIPKNSGLAGAPQKVGNLNIYELRDDQSGLREILKIGEASWENKKIIFLSGGEKIRWVNNGEFLKESVPKGSEIEEEYNPFKETTSKPSHMNAGEISEFIRNSESESEERVFTVALEKRYTTLVLPLAAALMIAPFAISLNRRGKIINIGYAVGMWLLFLVVAGSFEQFGAAGSLPARVAVWSPLALFSLTGGYLLSKVRT